MFQKDDNVRVKSTQELGVVTADESNGFVNVLIGDVESTISATDLELVEVSPNESTQDEPGDQFLPVVQEDDSALQPLREQTDSTSGRADFSWVTLDHTVALFQWWGAEWQPYLTSWLDTDWPSWQSATRDEKQQWLNAQISSYSGNATGTTISANMNPNAYATTGASVISAPDDFSWVTQDQVGTLYQWYGDQWQPYLKNWLDTEWQNWQSAAPRDKQVWLAERISAYMGYATSSTITTNANPSPNPNVTADTAAVTVREDFSWLTPHQRSVFTQWWGGSWEAELSNWLTERWGGWRDGNPVLRENWLTMQLADLGYVATPAPLPGATDKKRKGRDEKLDPVKRVRLTQAAGVAKVNEHLDDLQTKKSSKRRTRVIKTRDDFIEFAMELDSEMQKNIVDVYNSGVKSTRVFADEDFISMADVKGGEQGPPWYVEYWSEGEPRDAQENALVHFRKHSRQYHFNYGSVEAYTQAALDFKQANKKYAQYQARKGNMSVICRYSRSQQCGEYLVFDPTDRIVSFYPLGGGGVEQYIGTKVDTRNTNIFVD